MSRKKYIPPQPAPADNPLYRIWIRTDKETSRRTTLQEVEVYAKLHNINVAADGKFMKDIRQSMARATQENPLETAWAGYYPRNVVEAISGPVVIDKPAKKTEKLETYTQTAALADEKQEEPEEIPVQNQDINAKNEFGHTMLHLAAKAGNEQECDRLISLGAKKNIKDNSGKMAWQKAEAAGYNALAEKLKS